MKHISVCWKNVYLCKYTISKYVKMEKLPLIELAELNKSIIFRDSFQDIFSIADLDGERTFDGADFWRDAWNPSGLCFLHCQTE